MVSSNSSSTQTNSHNQTHLHTLILKYIFICTHLHTHAYIYIHAHTHTLTCTHLHIHSHVFTHTFIYKLTVTYTHIHLHTHFCILNRIYYDSMDWVGKDRFIIHWASMYTCHIYVKVKETWNTIDNWRNRADYNHAGAHAPFSSKDAFLPRNSQQSYAVIQYRIVGDKSRELEEEFVSQHTIRT